MERGRSGAPLPTVVLGGGGSSTVPSEAPHTSGLTGAVAASGVVVPARQASLAWGVGGRVAEVHVAVGDVVEAAQPLLSLDGRTAQAQLEQAQAALAAAQANHDLLVAGAASGDLRQAQASVDGAKAALAALLAEPRPENVAQAQANLTGAEAALALLESGSSALELDAGRLAVEEAKGRAMGRAEQSRCHMW